MTSLKKHIKKVLKEETNFDKILLNLVILLFDGFNDVYYDWAEYNCGMGVCCDPYAVGFTLPSSDYNDYLFLLVDGDNCDLMGDYPSEISDELPEVCYEPPNIKNPQFDTLVLYEIFVEEIEEYLGPSYNWKSSLLNIINNKFGCNASDIITI